MDIYYLVISKIVDEKMKFLKDLIPLQEEMGVFDFLKIFHKRGIEWAIKNPKYTKIGVDFHTSKTLEKSNLIELLNEEAYKLLNSTPDSFLIKPIKNSIEKGEISTNYSIKYIDVYVKAIWQGISSVLNNKEVYEILGKEGEEIFDDFINILKFGLSNK